MINICVLEISESYKHSLIIALIKLPLIPNVSLKHILKFSIWVGSMGLFSYNYKHPF